MQQIVDWKQDTVNVITLKAEASITTGSIVICALDNVLLVGEDGGLAINALNTNMESIVFTLRPPAGHKIGDFSAWGYLVAAFSDRGVVVWDVATRSQIYLVDFPNGRPLFGLEHVFKEGILVWESGGENPLEVWDIQASIQDGLSVVSAAEHPIRSVPGQMVCGMRFLQSTCSVAQFLTRVTSTTLIYHQMADLRLRCMLVTAA